MSLCPFLCHWKRSFLKSHTLIPSYISLCWHSAEPFIQSLKSITCDRHCFFLNPLCLTVSQNTSGRNMNSVIWPVLSAVMLIISSPSLFTFPSCKQTAEDLCPFDMFQYQMWQLCFSLSYWILLQFFFLAFWKGHGWIFPFCFCLIFHLCLTF